MTTPADTLPQVQAVVTLLRAAGLTVYLSDSGGSVAGPFVVVHPSPGASDGTLGDRFKDLTVAFQTTAVGTGPEMALDTHDIVQRTLKGAAPAVTGRVPQPIWADGDPGTVSRDDTASLAMFYAVAQWKFRTSI